MKMRAIPSLDGAVPIWAVPAVWQCKCGHGVRLHLELGAKLYCVVCRAPCAAHPERL